MLLNLSLCCLMLKSDEDMTNNLYCCIFFLKCIFKDAYLKMHEKKTTKLLNSAVNTDESSCRLHVF